jgi:hypothetical protein
MLSNWAINVLFADHESLAIATNHYAFSPQKGEIPKPFLDDSRLSGRTFVCNHYSVCIFKHFDPTQEYGKDGQSTGVFGIISGWIDSKSRTKYCSIFPYFLLLSQLLIAQKELGERKSCTISHKNARTSLKRK